MISPIQAISAAYRAAAREVGRKPIQQDAYEAFLIMASEHLDIAAKAFANVALKRETATVAQMEILEHHAYMTCMQATISGLMLLAHFPYMRSVAEAIPGERLN